MRRGVKKVNGLEGIDFVVCLECEGRYTRLPTHLKWKHNMSGEQYLKKHPGVYLTCTSTLIKYKKPNSSHYKKGGKSWNKNLTKETDPRVRRMSDTMKKMYASGERIHHFLGKKFSDEHRKKISTSQLGKLVSEETKKNFP